MSNWKRALRGWLAFALAFAINVPVFSPAPAMAAGTFPGGPDGPSDATADSTPPMYAANDHTPMIVHYSASGLEPNTTYQVKVRFTVGTSPSGATNRGWTWNPDTDDWVQEREDWNLFPTVTSDASGTVGINQATNKNAAWVWTKFGDESKSGDYYIMISLNQGGSLGTSNCTTPTAVSVLDMKTNGSWWHNGAATSTQADKRTEVTSPESTATVYSLVKSEPNGVDDDADGTVDNEQFGPAGANGDFRMAVPASTTADVFISRSKKFNDRVTPQPDTEVALMNSGDQSVPTSPTALNATASNHKIALAWDAATDNTGVDHYNVYRWMNPVGSVPYTPPHELIGTSSGTTFDDTDASLGDGNAWNYEVRAVDAAGNVSARSASDSATSVWTVPSVTTSVTPAPNAAGWYDEDPAIDLVGTNTTSIEYSWESSVGPWTEFTETLEADEGVNTLYYRGIDDVGPGSVSSQVFRVDTISPTNPTVDATTVASNVSTNEKFPVSWDATETAVGSPVVYDVQYRINSSGSWLSWRTGAISKTATFNGSAGGTYEFRSRARDAAGNTTGWSPVDSTMVPYDNTSASYSSGWFTATNSNYWKGSAKSTSIRGKSASFTFSGGKALYLLMTASPSRGKAYVYVDGSRVKTIDTGSPTWQHRKVLYIKGLSGSGKHTVRIVNLATPGRSRIDFDGIVVKR